MAIRYNKQEMADLRKTGKKNFCYKAIHEQNLKWKDFVKLIAKNRNDGAEGEIISTVDLILKRLAMQLEDGNSVTIDGLGTFSLKIRLKKGVEKDTFDKEDENTPQHNAASLEVHGINFRADKKLIDTINANTKIYLNEKKPIQTNEYTQEQRLNMLKDYLQINHAIRVANYMELVDLPKHLATSELNKFASNKDTGIIAIGSHSQKFFTLKSTTEE